MNQNNRTYLTAVLWFFVSAFCVPAFANVTAHLDRSQITEGETVRLTIEAAGRVSEMPDTRALNEDFEVTGTMSGSRVNIVNGKMDSRTTWTISLIPKSSGTLTIPPLEVNGEKTPELTVQVNEVSGGDAPDTTTPIFLENEIDKTDPYAQGMALYTQRVFFAVNLAQGSLSEPEHEDLLVRKLGEDREYQTQRNGRAYTVIERTFALFPQVSGELVIPAPVLNAQIPEVTRSHDPFFDRFLSNTRPVRLRGEAVTLNVRSRPDQSQARYWLPAESVELFETWQPEDGTANFGEPIMRNITIKAVGVLGEQLPELELVDPEGFKLYPDRSQSDTQIQSHSVQGEKTLRLAYMPTQPGKHVLPAFTLHWWDMVSDSEKTVTLPERTLEILPATTQQHTIAPSYQTDSADSHFFPADQMGSGTSQSITGGTGWFWAAIVFAVLWLGTLILFWRSRSQRFQPQQQIQSTVTDTKNAREAKKHFLAACRENDAKMARHYLIKWAANHWPQSPPTGLDELALRLDHPDIREALKKLDRALYQNSDDSWDGEELAGLIGSLPKQGEGSRDNGTSSVLPGLYR